MKCSFKLKIKSNHCIHIFNTIYLYVHSWSNYSAVTLCHPDLLSVLQVALRHKSEMEHQRNKLRQRAKRRGQCEFPSMDDIMDAFGDGPVQGEVAQRLYSSAHDHMDCILQAEAASPATPTNKR